MGSQGLLREIDQSNCWGTRMDAFAGRSDKSGADLCVTMTALKSACKKAIQCTVPSWRRHTKQEKSDAAENRDRFGRKLTSLCPHWGTLNVCFGTTATLREIEPRNALRVRLGARTMKRYTRHRETDVKFWLSILGHSSRQLSGTQ